VRGICPLERGVPHWNACMHVVDRFYLGRCHAPALPCRSTIFRRKAIQISGFLLNRNSTSNDTKSQDPVSQKAILPEAMVDGAGGSYLIMMWRVIGPSSKIERMILF